MNYSYRVKTICEYNNSNYTSAKGFTTLIPECNTPNGLSSSEVTPTTAKISWLAVSDATSYKVRYRKSGDNSWLSKLSTPTYNNLSGLTSGTTYEFQVQSTCSGGGVSAFSSSAYFVTPNDVCNQPNNVTVSNISETSATVSWDEVMGANKYTIRYRPAGGAWSAYTKTVNYITFNNLSPATTYDVQVKSNCEYNNSTYTSIVQFTTDEEAVLECVVPANLSKGAVTANTAYFSWNTVGGASAYTVKYRKTGAVWQTETVSQNHITLSSLEPLSDYQIKVKSECTDGSSTAYTALLSFTTKASSCEAPVSLIANDIIDMNATIGWQSNAAQFVLHYRKSDENIWTEIPVNANTYTFNDLLMCSEYKVEVKAICGNEESAYSSTYVFNSFCMNDDPGADLYCEAKGLNANYEWIDKIQIGDLVKQSGKDNGYGNHTAGSLGTIITGEAYTITLTPGYAGSAYPEYWKVWIDLDQNGDFANNELVFDAGESNNSAISGTLTLPLATEGDTRMRIAMKYKLAPDACEVFNYGEVEDHTVTLVNGENAGENMVSYCPAASTNANYEWIESIKFGGLNHISGSDNGYGDHTDQIAEITAGQNYSLSLTPGYAGSPYNEYWRAWIDLNKDGDFDDAGEMIYDAGMISNKPVVASVLIPGNAEGGKTRMRITMKYNGPADACGLYSYGEVEDYTVNITPGDGTGAPVYCISKSNNANYEWIANIELGNFSNSSASNNGYKDFTNLPSANLYVGENYELNLTPGYKGSAYNEYWSVWIDFNQDGSFTEDELAFDAGAVSKQVVTGTINIPLTATLGKTRMRVSMKYNGAADACEVFGYGEVEDYTVDILGNSGMEAGCEEVMFEYEQDGNTVTFFNQSHEIYDVFYWDFGDSTGSSETNPSHIYKKAGEYTFQIDAYSTSTGCSNSFKGFIYISNNLKDMSDSE